MTGSSSEEASAGVTPLEAVTTDRRRVSAVLIGLGEAVVGDVEEDEEVSECKPETEEEEEVLDWGSQDMSRLYISESVLDVPLDAVVEDDDADDEDRN